MCWAARHGAWTRQSMPCSRTWLYSEESFWQLCHHQTARSDCLRTEAHGSAKIWPDGPPHFNEESPRSATLVKASVCVVQLSGRKQIITLIHLARLRQASCHPKQVVLPLAPMENICRRLSPKLLQTIPTHETTLDQMYRLNLENHVINPECHRERAMH